jgi:hypothetical protein
LLEMILDSTIVEDITVFTKDKIFEYIEGSDGPVGLVLIGLDVGFGCVSMLVVVAVTPEVMNSYPHDS